MASYNAIKKLKQVENDLQGPEADLFYLYRESKEGFEPRELKELKAAHKDIDAGLDRVQWILKQQ